NGLLPPELIVQDEVHLISGPLGTMVGLYETAVEGLCRWETPEGVTRRPKIIASTATTRRSEAQMRALFARDVALFPPPGVDDSESFFATHDPDSPDRRYLGICPVGHPMKGVLLRLYITALGAAEALRLKHGDAADAWMTALGYFNSLRELGGTRRLIEDVVRSRAAHLSERRPLDYAAEPHRWLADRQINALPVELTSRERTSKIAEAKDRLALAHDQDLSVDVALATNMISVGVDIDRLGLMIVAGQPKATAEYIQATSRVGRQARSHPGLVLVCLNAQRARDRSHFEHFSAFHQSFYRHVEVNSLTPFSAPALDRGLVGALMALVRLSDPAFMPSRAAKALLERRAEAEWVVEALSERAKRSSALDAEGERRLAESVSRRAAHILDAWEQLITRAKEGAAERRYSPFEDRRGGPEALLKTQDQAARALRFTEERDVPAERLFIAPTSMRDVEPSVDLWVSHAQKIEAEREAGRAQKKNKTIKAEGEIRRSQLLTGYGPGALVDLIDYAVIIGGLGYWRMGQHEEDIHDPRLIEQIAQGRAALKAPPARVGDPNPSQGIQAKLFPRWFVCQGCRALVKVGQLKFKKGRFHHDCRAPKAPLAVPVRFLMACARGHIEEVNWVWLAHLGDPICDAPRLKLIESRTGDFNEVNVRCVSCKKGTRIGQLLEADHRPKCSGWRPWLKGDDTREECDQRAHLIVRTASNVYFSQTVSALSIPEPANALYDGVKAQRATLESATKETLPVFLTIPHIARAVGDATDAEILEMIARVKADERPERDPLRVAEYKQLTRAPDEVRGQGPEPGERFFARRALTANPSGVARVVLVHALREVRAQIGFTRLDFPNTSIQGEHDLDVHTAPLGLDADWLPAVEIFGEGIFLQLDEAAVRAWEARPEVKARAEQLRVGFTRHHQDRDKAPEFYGARFYLLHSLSHLLITALSLKCGYPASAIRERIYCADATSAHPMAGILLSTGTPGTEGTLGGLVDQGRDLAAHLKYALELGRLCSNDPVCAGHDPSDEAGRPMEGAACHGCLFIAESSCERFNRALDRALVVPTLGHPSNLAFFGAP
ncbi:DUF1998 domain-containing protein, partial [Myxococcota bacterium]|nr:DUF1998 domain-containing protein [Myxococcota bacterium]